MNCLMKTIRVMILGCVFAFFLGWVMAWADPAVLPDLTELSIEELANIEVISTSKTPVRQSHSPAAIYVVTAEDIRRSGATSFAETLRLVPGIQVARISSSKWAISSRGFNSRYSNKLLVLMDGRTLYSPLFSGVFWESQDYMLEDIERIEVIRGPGASLWGANAMNGVINIITKHSKDTTGVLATVGAGDYEKGFARARYGEKIGEQGYIRGYATYFERDEMVLADGSGSHDSWDRFQTGFRSDAAFGDRVNLTVQGDYYKGELDERHTLPTLDPPSYSVTFDGDNAIEGYNVIGRLEVRQDSGAELAFQLYGDSVVKEEAGEEVGNDLLDLDMQYTMAPWNHHELILGLGFRVYKDSIDYGDAGYSFDKSDVDDVLYSSFFQDTIRMSDTFDLILGSRFEQNDHTGFEVQPNLRFLWSLSDANVLWGAVSRAVRTPSRGERSIHYNLSVIPPLTGSNSSPYPVATVIRGSDQIDSEEMTAFELGYRVNASKQFSVDTTAFYYLYDGIVSYSLSDYEFLTDPTEHYAAYLDVGNLVDAQTWGFEMSANWQPMDFMRLQAVYSFISMHFELKDQSNTVYPVTSTEDTPEHQASLRAYIDLPRNLECDVALRYVDGISGGEVPAYTDMDLRVGWRPGKHVEVSVCGNNLFHDQRSEFLGSYILSQPTEIYRSFYGKVTLRF